MMDYSELVKSLRICAIWKDEIRFPGKDGCNGCAYHDEERDVCTSWDTDELREHIMLDAADAIEELLRAVKKMHTWIFLHSYDEQEAYDECGLSDEMNAALGYGGQFEIKVDPCADCVRSPPSSTDGKPCCACNPANPLTNCHEAKEETE